MDNLRALRVFIEVAETQSLSGAARNLSISAPTVTRILSDYEAELGVLLFHRTTRAVTLTGPGRTFLEDARHIVQSYETATDSVKGAHREPTGLLRLTAPTMFGQLYVLPILTQYLDQYEDVRLEAIFLDRVVNLVEEGFDIAVRIGDLPDSNLIATQVGAVRRVICASPDYLKTAGVPKKLNELADHKIIIAGASSAISEWRFSDEKVSKVASRLTLSSIPASIQAAVSGWGLTRVLSYQIGQEINDGTLVTVLEEFDTTSMPIHLVHAEGRAASAKVRAFLDMARIEIRGDTRLAT